MPLDAVIFDIDGTLVDTNEAHARTWAQAFRQHGYGLPISRVRPEIGKGGPKLLESVIGAEAAEADGDGLRAAHSTHYHALLDAEGARVFPEAVALVEAVKAAGLRTAVATAAEEDELAHVLEAAGLDLAARVDAVVNGSDVETSKPAPDVVHVAAEKLGLSPAQCALIGDTPYDAIASLHAGAVCLGVCTGVHTADDMHRAGARASYADPADLLAHLDEALERAAPSRMRFTPEWMAALMDEALDEARAGLDAGELPIGSVLVDGTGRVVGRGHHAVRAAGNPTAHAALNAFADAAGRGALADPALVLVTTLEPGVIGLGAALEARVDTVVYALAAPENGGALRCRPANRPESPMPRLVGGIRAEASRELFAMWQETRGASDFVRRLSTGG